MIQLSFLIAVGVMQGYTCDKLYRAINTYIHVVYIYIYNW